MSVAVPDTLPWDQTRPYLNRADAQVDFYNAGCPQGYFAEVLPPPATDGVDIGIPGAVIRCRLATTTTPATLINESSPEFAVENMTRFNGAVADNMPMFPTELAVMGIIGLAIWWRESKSGRTL